MNKMIGDQDRQRWPWVDRLLRGFEIVVLLWPDTPVTSALVCVMPSCILNKMDPLLLKLYSTYTFSTSPDLCHRTTLLDTDVENCYITLMVNVYVAYNFSHLPSCYQNLLKLVESSNKNKNGPFF